MLSIAGRGRLLVATMCLGFLLGCEDKADPPIQATHSREPASADTNVAAERTAVQTSSPATSSEAVDPAETQLREQVLKLTGRDLRQGTTARDSEGRPLGTTFSDGSKLSYQNSQPVRFTDPSGQATDFTFANGKLIRIVHPDGRTETFPVAE
jgi:YD repeat-containing protein